MLTCIMFFIADSIYFHRLNTLLFHDMSFVTDHDAIIDLIDKIDPVNYARTRNYIDGHVTRLSPYISRGVISTRTVMEKVLQAGYGFSEVEKFLQELAWRDYWQLVWMNLGERINRDIRPEPVEFSNQLIPGALVEARTGIEALDKGVHDLYESGYMHNHLRMYTASLACNIAGSHWREPARWMYYHLLDGDWASNALSWQWVAATNSAKKYYANQENINRYAHTRQYGTILDVSYDDLARMQTPEILKELMEFNGETILPEPSEINFNPTSPVFIYNWYNMDPLWQSGDSEANRILLLEPSVFKRYPVCERSIRFMLDLGKNISRLQVFTGEFADLVERYQPVEIHYREHPLNSHYRGIEHPREWLSDVRGEYRSFFAFWKKCSKDLRERFRRNA